MADATTLDKKGGRAMEGIKPRFRGVSHQFAAFVALGAGAVLVAMAPSDRATWASLVYALSLAALFTISAIYHRPMWSPKARQRMKKLDHAAIFLLIAGTYTPFCLLALREHDGGLLIYAIWGAALLGIMRAVFWVDAPRFIAVGFYLLLGWTILPYVPELYNAAGPVVLALIGVGGLFYTVGAVCYALKRPNPIPNVFGYHEVFHALVIMAAIVHFSAVLLLVRQPL